MRTETYKTKQKEVLADTIKSMNKEFTIKDIYSKLNEEVGLTTIYRFIDKLVEEGKIKKTADGTNIYYQYLCDCDHENHFYLKCDKCGSLIHVDCDCITDLSEHIFKHHNFIPNTKSIIINGICESCRKEA
jgi:Fur family ferric uptake transcriptional regulator